MATTLQAGYNNLTNTNTDKSQHSPIIMSASKTSNSGKVWLITGCSSGFGKEIALAALKRGDKVIATARSASKLAELVEAGAHGLQLDVTSPLAELEKVANQAIAVYGRVDVLVNNAGYLTSGVLEAATPEETLAQFNTNVFGQLNVTRAFLPHLRERRSGTIAFIGSMAGWTGVGGLGLYGASKFALEGLTEALREEVAPLGIAVTVIEPGAFRTAVLTDSNMIEVGRHIADYDKTTAGVHSLIQTVQTKWGDTTKGAQRIVDVLTLSGSAAGRKEIPVRLALGADAYLGIKKKLETSLALLEEWKDLTQGTEHDDAVTV